MEKNSVFFEIEIGAFKIMKERIRRIERLIMHVFETIMNMKGILFSSMIEISQVPNMIFHENNK